jgi:hypothetical protein
MKRTFAFAVIIAGLFVLDTLGPSARIRRITSPLYRNPGTNTRVSDARAFRRRGSNPGFEIDVDPASGERRFVTRRGSMTLLLTSTEAIWHLRNGAAGLRMRFVGATPERVPIAVTRLPGVTNNFIGADPSAWRTGVARYAGVTYKQMYPGIDVEYDTSGETLEYSFIVEPHSDPTRIRMRFDGADRIEINAAGDLMVYSAGESLRQPEPSAYQQSGSSRQSVHAEYIISDKNTVGIRVGAHDSARSLIIDPLVYSTYLGGSGSDGASAITVDNAGNAYVVGSTNSSDFPTPEPLHAAVEIVFVTKFDASGQLVYSTYLGGNGRSAGNGIAIDALGNVYITGGTSSTNFPTTYDAFQVSVSATKSCDNHQCGRGFIAKLSATGTLVYSTYLGDADASPTAIAVGAAGDTYVTGVTNSRDFPVSPGAFQSKLVANCSAYGDYPCWSTFVTRLNAAGNALIYSTYLAGAFYTAGTAIAVDTDGSAYVAGDTYGQFPTTESPFQPTFGYMFVTKLNPTGTALVYSSYLGGTNTGPIYPFDPDEISGPTGIAVDDGGNAYVTGWTLALDHITTPGALFPKAPGVGICAPTKVCADAFITKINASGSALVYSTYLGGTDEDGAGAIAVDRAGRAYITGWTSSENFPVTDSAVQAAPSQKGGCRSYVCTDVFIATLAADGSAIEYSTYLGGNGRESGTGIALDGTGAVYAIGGTTSDNFPTLNPFQPDNHGGFDVFLAKIIPTVAGLVNGLRFDRQNVMMASSYSATISGSDLLTSQTFFDVRFTAPGSTVSDIALNWQTGLTGGHPVPVGTPVGRWTITGVRPHQVETDHTGDFLSVSATITVSP